MSMALAKRLRYAIRLWADSLRDLNFSGFIPGGFRMLGA